MQTHDGETIYGWNDKGNVFLAKENQRMLVYIGNGREYTLYFIHGALNTFLAEQEAKRFESIRVECAKPVPYGC